MAVRRRIATVALQRAVLTAVVVMAVGFTAALGSASAGTADRAPVARAVHAAGPARILGTFTMDGLITQAVNVRGERAGERIARQWVIRSRNCVDSTCRNLVLLRSRGPGVSSLRTVLHLVGPGTYRGAGVFWAPLRCLGRTYRRGSRVPYTIRLWVRARSAFNGVWLATGLAASYVSPAREDRTPCPLGPAADAAVYVGRQSLMSSTVVMSGS